jgi:hypothetical protein
MIFFWLVFQFWLHWSSKLCLSRIEKVFVLVFSTFSLHFNEKSIKFSHLLYSQSMFFLNSLWIRSIFFIVFAQSSLMQRRFPCRYYFVNCIRIYEFCNIRSIKFLKPVSYFFFRGKFQEIFKSIPLFESFIYNVIGMRTFRTSLFENRLLFCKSSTF